MLPRMCPSGHLKESFARTARSLQPTLLQGTRAGLAWPRSTAEQTRCGGQTGPRRGSSPGGTPLASLPQPGSGRGHAGGPHSERGTPPPASGHVSVRSSVTTLARYSHVSQAEQGQLSDTWRCCQHITRNKHKPVRAYEEPLPHLLQKALVLGGRASGGLWVTGVSPQASRPDARERGPWPGSAWKTPGECWASLRSTDRSHHAPPSGASP